MTGEGGKHGRKKGGVSLGPGCNRIKDLVPGCAHSLGQIPFQGGNKADKPLILLRVLGFAEDGAMGNQMKAALFRLELLRFQPAAEDVAFEVEPQVLAHAIERGLGVEGGTVAGTTDVVDGGAAGRGDFPDVEPEAALEDAAVEVEAVRGGSGWWITL